MMNYPEISSGIYHQELSLRYILDWDDNPKPRVSIHRHMLFLIYIYTIYVVPPTGSKSALGQVTFNDKNFLWWNL